MSALYLELVIGHYDEGARWTWRLLRNGQIVSSSGSQLFSRRVDCARGAEVGTGISGVTEALAGKGTKAGDVGRAIRRLETVVVRIVDQRGGDDA